MMNILFKKSFLFLTLIICVKGSSQNIYTYAGTGTSGFSGDGGAATSAQVNFPLGVLADVSGNVYISDSYNSRIRIVNGSGIISAFAGGGATTGDGGPATNALIGNPYKICFDVSGNIYVAEYSYNRVRKISTTGIITTVAGDGSISGGFFGDGGPATLAKLNGPSGVAVDASGNIYIADLGNSRIRMVNASGTISTIAGTGVNTYSGDNGPATLATLNSPTDVDIDGSNIIIADYNNKCVRKINSSGIITTIAGTGIQGNSGDGGPATSAQMGAVTGIDIDVSGNLYIADVVYGTIRKVNTLGIISTVAGSGTQGYSGDGGPAVLAKLFPNEISVDANGNIYIAESNNRIRIVCVSSCAMGISENKISVNLRLYPNPVSTILQIFAEENEFQNSEIEITNYLGQTIFKTPFTNSIDVSKISQGIYTLKIITKDNRNFYSKFVKE